MTLILYRKLCKIKTQLRWKTKMSSKNDVTVEGEGGGSDWCDDAACAESEAAVDCSVLLV